MEKGEHTISEAVDHSSDYVEPSGNESKQGGIAEARALYGDLQTAEEYGYVTRGFVKH